MPDRNKLSDSASVGRLGESDAKVGDFAFGRTGESEPPTQSVCRR